MEESADIVSLAARRRRRASPAALSPAVAAAAGGAGRARARFVAGAVVIALAVTLSGLTCGESRGTQEDLARQAPVERAAYFERAWTDLAAGCRAGPGESDAVHHHCVEQARFVLLFPECTADCRSRAMTLLPRSRFSR
jgi:hypothetical protein